MNALVGAPLASASRRSASRGRRAALIAVAVVLLAELMARLVQPQLRTPQAWPTAELQHKYDRIQTLAKTHRVRTVLLGDSLLDAAARPSLLPGGNDDFNASLAGETLPTIVSWAMKVVAPRLRPTTVVLGFGVNVLNALSGEAATYGVYRRSRVVRQAEGEGSLLDLADVWLRGHVALYRDRVVLRNPFSEPKVGGAFVYDPPLSPDGWNEGFQGLRLGTTAAALSTAAAEVRLNLLQGFAVSEAKIVELGDLIDSLHRNGVDVILVTLPASSALIAAVGGAPQYQTAVGTLLAIGRSHGARTASAGVWPTTDFADAAHLNLAGTAQFSSWLGRVLRPEPAGK